MRETYQSVVYSEGYMTSPPLVVLGRVFLCLQTALPLQCSFGMIELILGLVIILWILN